MTKVVLPKENASKSTPKVVLLPLTESDDLYTLDKANSITYTLSTQPGTANGSPYKYQARILAGDESVRAMIRWHIDVERVTVGLGVATNGPAIVPIIRSLMRGTPTVSFNHELNRLATISRRIAAQTAYDNAAAAAGGVLIDGARQAAEAARDATLAEHTDVHATVENVRDAIRHTLRSLMPRQVLAKVKRYLRRECRKPVDMTIRNYYQQIFRVNTEELTRLPPYADNQNFSEDELIDIVLFGTPRVWQVEMERQGFDPLEHTLAEIVDFMERIESTEELTSNGKVASGKKTSKDSKSNATKTDGNKKFCLIHGHGSHTSDECNHLKDVAKKAKNGKGKSDDSSKKSGGKTGWVKKAAEGTSNSKKELAALITKQVQAGVKKELASLDKKRKSSDKEDMNAIEVDVDAFTYGVDNLDISSDSEIST